MVKLRKKMQILGGEFGALCSENEKRNINCNLVVKKPRKISV